MSGDDEIQVFLNGSERKIYTININKNSSIADLRRKCSKETGLSDDEMRINSGIKELRANGPSGNSLHLSDYNIRPGSNLFLVLRLPGGSQSQTEEVTEVQKIYGPDVQLTDKPDMFTLDDEKGGQRAEMPCTHAISPESLTDFCRSLLTAGRFEFRCPYKKNASDPPCDHLWDFFTVKRLAVLSKEETNEFDKKVAENYLRKAVGIQECPSCHSYCQRQRQSDRRVVCPICTKRNGKSYDFCWYCLKTWLAGGTSDCGNDYCTGEDQRIRIMKTCEKKTVVGVENCPAVRACPECGMLIEHKEACKQMVCPCGQKFCFICLKKADVNGSYQCGAWNFKCGIAPIQTTLPGEY